MGIYILLLYYINKIHKIKLLYNHFWFVLPNPLSSPHHPAEEAHPGNLPHPVSRETMYFIQEKLRLEILFLTVELSCDPDF